MKYQLLAIVGAFALVLTLGACSPAQQNESSSPSSTVETIPDEAACKNWVKDYNQLIIELDAISPEDTAAAAPLFSAISEKEITTSELAVDSELKQLLLDMSTNDRNYASDLVTGAYTEWLPVEDADIYERCYELGIQTEPKKSNGTAADFYIATAPPKPGSKKAKLSDAEQEQIMNSALEAVQAAYYDCFPAVAAGVTILEFMRYSPEVSGGAFVQLYTPNGENSRDGIVTVTAGDKVLQFETKQDLRGNVKSITPLNEETNSALAASQCSQNDY